MASTSSNPEQIRNRDPPIHPRRKKRRTTESIASEESQPIRWRSPASQTAYSTKLIEAIRHVRRGSASASISSSSRAVRDAADKILAVAARGRSRWSRAILANRLKRQLRGHKKAIKPDTGDIRLNKAVAGGGSMVKKTPLPLPPLQRSVRLLGRLVPGCRKLSFPNLLEETTDYISALEMQVRAMSALAELLTGAGSADRRDLT